MWKRGQTLRATFEILKGKPCTVLWKWNCVSVFMWKSTVPWQINHPRNWWVQTDGNALSWTFNLHAWKQWFWHSLLGRLERAAPYPSLGIDLPSEASATNRNLGFTQTWENGALDFILCRYICPPHRISHRANEAWIIIKICP